MDDAKITCPECSAEIALTESLAGPMMAELRRTMTAERETALAQQKSVIEAQATEAAAASQAAKLATLELAATEAAEQAAKGDA